MSDLVRTGMSLDERTVERLDEIADKWDSRRSHQVKRSEMARETLPLGITALNIIDDSTTGVLTRHDREAALRQALYDFDFGDSSESDMLIDALAESEEIDRDELEQAVLRLKLDG